MFAERLVDWSPWGEREQEATVERRQSPGERRRDGPLPGQRAEMESFKEGVVTVLVTIHSPLCVGSDPDALLTFTLHNRPGRKTLQSSLNIPRDWFQYIHSPTTTKVPKSATLKSLV